MTETNMIASNPYEGERRAGHGRLSAAGRQPADRRSRDRRGARRTARSASSRSRVRTSSRAIGGCRRRRRAEFRPDGYFITGDLGRIDERGYLHIVGRAKDLIISGGFNVYPKEIEGEIDAIAGVVESAVIGLAASRLRRGRDGDRRGASRARRSTRRRSSRRSADASRATSRPSA